MDFFAAFVSLLLVFFVREGNAPKVFKYSNQRQSAYRQKGLFKADSFSTSVPYTPGLNSIQEVEFNSPTNGRHFIKNGRRPKSLQRDVDHGVQMPRLGGRLGEPTFRRSNLTRTKFYFAKIDRR